MPAYRKKEHLPVEIQLGPNAVKLTPEGWKLGRLYHRCFRAVTAWGVGREEWICGRREDRADRFPTCKPSKGTLGCTDTMFFVHFVFSSAPVCTYK